MIRKTTIVKRMNKIFKTTDSKYQVSFIGETCNGNEVAMVTSETPTGEGGMAVDYYGEYNGNKGMYSWVAPRIDSFCEKHNLYYEWESCAAIGFYEK